MEVEERREDGNVEGRVIYDPADKEGKRGEFYEPMYLKPSRIIPESRLRYGKARGHTAFIPYHGWAESWGGDEVRLILDPAPEEKKDEWEEWVEECPACDETRRWLKRMPKRRGE
jgi:hypothetical protein